MAMRERLFWFLDTLQRGSTAAHLRVIESTLHDNAGSSAREYQEKKLRELIQHAEKTTQFYKGLTNFSEFPVINKNNIRQKKEQFLSSVYSPKELIRVTTSGSTGTPFEVFQDFDKRKRQAAENIYFNERCGFKIGDRLYFLRIWNKINQLSYLQRKLKNIIPVEASDLSSKKVASIIGMLKTDKSRKSLLAYATTYEALAFQLRKLNLSKTENTISCCISMSEALDEGSRETLQNFFDCGVFARYSNSENGFIAHQVPGFGTDYLINTASFVVELLDMESDRPVPTGSPGRIVVTDLFNYAMPMIRYDTGDVGIAEYRVDENGNRHWVLKTILGRKLDFIRGANSALISPHVIDYALRQFPGMQQFQIVQQTETEFTLKLNLEKGISINELDVKNALFTYLNKNSTIHIEYVDEIPLLASGKRKIVVSLLEK